MPHQCLKCGKIFEEGSPQLLKGCSKCGGNRFFYTKKPLDDKERNTKIKEVKKDLNTAITELMETPDKELMNNTDDWVHIKPKDIRKAMKKHLTENNHTGKKDDKVLDSIIDENYRKQVIDQINKEMEKKDTPETIGIEKTGSYNIDLKGLLEEEPIIIEKDGTYTIHLPSAFKMINKEK